MADQPLSASQSSLPLPAEADLAFWRGEVERSTRELDKHKTDWTENIDWYAGCSTDAKAAVSANADYVAINADFYQTEQKLAQLFYETPELQLAKKGALGLMGQLGQPGQPANPDQQRSILGAHRQLLDELLGDDHADVLSRAVHPAIKDCLCVSGVGAVLLGYEPTLRDVPAPQLPGEVLGLHAPVSVPIYQEWYTLRFSPNKLLIPADFHATDWDKAPWLGMRFRMPLTVAKKQGLVPETFAGSTKGDAYVLNESAQNGEGSGVPYVDGQAIWYRAVLFDPAAFHPEAYRELILIDGLDAPARHRDSPHQTLLPTGRLSGDSLIGNPIHPLSIRSVPDSAWTPSDSKMTRPQVRELSKFRTQTIQNRDANRTRVGYDIGKVPPDVLVKIENGSVGALIGFEEGALASGISSIIAPITTATPHREDFVAQDYIERDLEKTLGIDATGSGVSSNENESATKTALVERNRNVRMAHEQRQVLRWYLRLVDKMSALVCRYMTPTLAGQILGPELAQAWLAWDKQSADARIAFTAKPDSQIRLDAGAERKFKLDLYQFVAKDPNVVRVELLKELFLACGMDPSKLVVEELPEQKPEPSISIAVKGEDFVGPQAQQMRELLAQCGITISDDAIQSTASQMFQQMTLGIRDADGKAVKPVARPQEHGGTAEQVRPLSQQSADQSGQRSGPRTMEAA